MLNIKLTTRFKTLLLAAGTLPVSMIAAAQTTAATASEAPKSVWSNPLALAMLAIIVVLLLVIALLANVVLGTAEWHYKKQSGTAKMIAVLLALSLPAISQAQDAATAPVVTNIGGLSGTTFFMLLAVIGIELIVILVMAFFVRSFIAKEKAKAALAEGAISKEANWQQLWEKLNSFRPITEESKIDLGHNYDGIRELNNRLPGWWLYGFYATILFAGIYLWRYHVAHSAPLPGEELKIALIKGEEQTKAYLAKAANNVDENTVTYLKDAGALQSGEGIFKSTCKTCHGEKGEGNQIGPNLTDEYWIHGGSIKDIFKTIKYGYPEKGMQSWKDQYTPIQMAQVGSYIKSLLGSNPPNAKAPQGELYKEVAPAADSSTMPKQDTTLKNAISKN
jgi:cytochrome c oxidase cbb3-type subunit III